MTASEALAAAVESDKPAGPAAACLGGALRWSGAPGEIKRGDNELAEAVGDLRSPIYLFSEGKHYAFAQRGGVTTAQTETGRALAGMAPALSLRHLGDLDFCDDHKLLFPYMCGSMANGIASAEFVETAAKCGVLASYGAAGLGLDEIEATVLRLRRNLPAQPFCCNLIFTPNEPGHEDAVTSLYLRHGVSLVEASAYMRLTPALVRYRVHGISRDENGAIVAPNRIIAKASRAEVARQFMSPPPHEFLRQLVAAGEITETQAALAEQIPMAQDLTVEADSGGHTDRQAAITVLPAIIALRDQLQRQFDYLAHLRVGAAGGISTPLSAAAAFAMGAAYVVTGTVNQACVESGSSDLAREMLAAAGPADVTMAPAVDMFEMGVQLQVLKRGTMFAMRAQKLYSVYLAYDSVESIPAAQRRELEETIFRAPLAEIWRETCKFFEQRDQRQIDKAQRDPKHKLALICRWYLGCASRWAIAGEPGRRVDYQIWCGSAMGAFNAWSKDSWLAAPANRTVAAVALNILYGAAVVARVNHLNNQGLRLGAPITRLPPRAIRDIAARVSDEIELT